MERISAIVALCLMVQPSFAQTPENALLVQSVRAWELAARAENPADRVASLKEAQTAIDSILENHASSDLAVRVALGQADLPFTRTELDEAIASTLSEIEANSQTREVNGIIVHVMKLLEDVSASAPKDKPSAMRAYLLLREADAAVMRATEAFPLAASLDLLEANDLVRRRGSSIEEAAQRVASYCDGLAPQTCLLAEAERLTADVDDVLSRATALLEIGRAWAQAGQEAEAFRLCAEAEQISAEVAKSHARGTILLNIANSYAEAENQAAALHIWSEVEKIARGHDTPFSRAGTLYEIGLSMIEAGRQDKAYQLWSDAERIAFEIEEEDSRGWMMRDLVKAWAKAGNLAQAERIAFNIKQLSYQAGALHDIGGAYFDVGLE